MVEEDTTLIEDNTHYNEDDSCKIFVSRVPSNFDEDSVKRLIENRLGENSVSNVALVYEKDSSSSSFGNNVQQGDYDVGESDNNKHDDKDGQNDSADRNKNDNNNNETKTEHRGFGFVTLAEEELRQKAINLGTVRGGAKATSTKKYTIYLRPILRNDTTDEENKEKQICYLWASFRCPYGNECKFAHEGEGGCANKEPSKKKQKCFAFKKGKCKLGDKCPYYHDVDKAQSLTKGEGKNNGDGETDGHKTLPKNEKDCINWKTKGKCRKGDKCPYRHEESVRDKALSKKGKRKAGDKEKNRQPLSIRVFGLNYDTTQEDVRSFFQDCGEIVEITFPRFEDSGRSKGFCGVLFQSPKAVAKAVALNGQELHGRWLSIQEGKMYLKQWQEQQEKQQQCTRVEKTEVEEPLVGEFGQKVKKRKTHGYRD